MREAADNGLSPYLAVFNYHMNDAGEKAKQAFIRSFGQEGWDMHIQPFEDRGIMSLFNVTPTFHTMFYVTAVMLFASGDAELRPAAFAHEEFTVKVTRTSTTTLRVQAKNELSAAKIVDNVDFDLPPDDAWDHREYSYTVYAADGTELYSGDAQELT